MKSFKPGKIKKVISLISIIIILDSCSLLDPDPEEYDCYKIGRELTEEEKNIFPYKVGDTVLFTDGERDYYISCERIIDTIYTVNENGDIYCEGEVDKEDSYVRYYYLNTDIPLFDNCNKFGIAVSPKMIRILFYNFNGFLRKDFTTEFFMSTNRMVNNVKTNTPEEIYQIYIDSLNIESKWYYDIYQLSYDLDFNMHNVDTCYINLNQGILKYNLKQDKNISIK